MKKVKRCLLVLFSGILALAPGAESLAYEQETVIGKRLESLMPERADCMFEDGDVVGFIGDSITQVEYTGISYQEFIYNYYITRHPDWSLEFRNLGTASYMASDAVRLYSKSAIVTDKAIDGINKAVIMFGMNEALHDWAAVRYIQSINQLVTILNQKGIKNEDIILVAPTPFDQTRSSNYTEDGDQIEDTDDRLAEYTGELKILAEELGTHYIDLHTPMLWINGIVQGRNADDTLTVTDNVHPNAMGNVFAGFFFLYQQGAGKEVASVEIGEDDSAAARNASVSRLNRKGDRYLSFRYQRNSLPMAVPYEFNEATQYFEIVDEISWENLQVDGLHPEVNYKVYMNHLVVGTFTGEELQKGVNLTNLDLNPGQTAAKQIEVLNQSWHTKSSNYRAVVRKAMKQEATQEDVDTAYAEWATTTEAIRAQMYEIAEDSIEKEILVEVVSEDYHVFMGQEIWYWLVEFSAAAAAVGGLAVWLRKRRKRRKKEQENEV